MIKDSNASLTRTLRKDSQRMNMKTQHQYIPVQDISLSIKLSYTMSVQITVRNILVHNRSRVHCTVTGNERDHTNNNKSRKTGEDFEN